MNDSGSLSSLAWIVPLGSLLVFGSLAVLVVFLLAPRKDGRRIGGCGGCLIALAILLVVGVGATGCTALTLIGLSARAIEQGPVRAIELEWEPRPAPAEGRAAEAAPGPDFPVRLSIEVDGELDQASVSRFVRRRIRGDYSLTTSVREDEQGTVTRLEFGLPVDPEELSELERELREELPELKLPRGLRIELRRR